jgi:hypothetical protein
MVKGVLPVINQGGSMRMKEYLRALFGLVEKVAAGSLLIGFYQNNDLAFWAGWVLAGYCLALKILEVHYD